MNANKGTRRKSQEGIFTAISVGFCFLLVGIIFIITPNLYNNILDFFNDFGLVDVPHTDVVFFGPASPQLHSTVYQAAFQFSIALAVFQVFMLALRFATPSSWRKRTETVGNLVYWAGTSFLIQVLLIETTQWFAFWSAIIILAGVSLLARAAFMTAAKI